MKRFPVVLIGGPPGGIRSILTENLHRALRRQQVQHAVLVACADGETDWRHIAGEKWVRLLLASGSWTPEFVDRICRALARPHLPLLVDVGGRPRPPQERIFGFCTHAILIAPDQASRAHWRTLMARHSVPIIADLRSVPDGPERIDEREPVLRGTIAGLRPDHAARGPIFQSLADRLKRLFDLAPDTLRQVHLDSAPAEIVVELDRLKRTLRIGGDPLFWPPESLPQVIAYLPSGVPLALYDRAPGWLSVALGLLAFPAPLALFDVRLGWVSPPQVKMGRSLAVMDNKMIMAATSQQDQYTHIDFSLPYSFVDILDVQELLVVDVPLDRGVILGSKLPPWLLVGIALAYRDAPWVAVVEPMLEGAVVVHSLRQDVALGTIVSTSCGPRGGRVGYD
ncbi:MAG: hypothetical protein JXA89_03005 [Anaerolineae bacterium]|nr:hypothetical protein [Anaerolineae bacterium]